MEEEASLSETALESPPISSPSDTSSSESDPLGYFFEDLEDADEDAEAIVAAIDQRDRVERMKARREEIRRQRKEIDREKAELDELLAQEWQLEQEDTRREAEKRRQLAAEDPEVEIIGGRLSLAYYFWF